MIYLADFPELKEIEKIADGSSSIESRYGRAYRNIDPYLVKADLNLLLSVIHALDEYISGAVG